MMNLFCSLRRVAVVTCQTYFVSIFVAILRYAFPNVTTLFCSQRPAQGMGFVVQMISADVIPATLERTAVSEAVLGATHSSTLLVAT